MFSRIFQQSRSPIGIDFGTHTIRMLQLQSSGGRPAVVAAASQRLPAELPPSGPMRQQGIIAAIRDMIGNGGFSGRRVVTALPAGAIQYKNLRVPRMPADEMRSAVEWEAADRMHLPTAQMQIRFYDAGEVRQGEESRQEIILMAVDNQAVDEHLAILTACGLTPLAIEPVPNSLARLAARSESPDTDAPPRVVLDVGYSSTKVLVTRQGRVQFFKTIDIGGRQFDQAVANAVNLPVPEAAQLRRNQAQSPDDAGEPLFGTSRREAVERAVAESLRGPISDLAREAQLCLRYHSVTFRGRRPEQAALVGGEAHEPNLRRHMADVLGIQTDLARPLHDVDTSAVRMLRETGVSHCEWAGALGLALRQAAGRRMQSWVKGAAA